MYLNRKERMEALLAGLGAFGDTRMKPLSSPSSFVSSPACKGLGGVGGEA